MVLMGVGGLLARNLRRVDLVGCLGEARFGLCLPGLALSEARTVVQRLRGTVAQLHQAARAGDPDHCHPDQVCRYL